MVNYYIISEVEKRKIGYILSVIVMWQKLRKILALAYFALFPNSCALTNKDEQLYNYWQLNKQRESEREGHNIHHNIIFVYLPFNVFYVIGHQPVELRTVSGGGRGVLQDGDVWALFSLTVDPVRAAVILTWRTQREASLKHVVESCHW